MFKKQLKMLVCSIATFMFAVILFFGVNVNAKAVNHKDVKIYFHSTESIRMTVKKSAKAAGVQVELKNDAMKTVGKETAKSGTVYFNDLDPAKIYYYRVREYTVKNNQKQWDTWSSFNAFSTCYADFKPANKMYSVWLNTPKAKGVARYEIWMSAVGVEKGFSKIGTVDAEKRVYMSKLKGKAFKKFKKNQAFYVFLKPVLGKGTVRGYYSRTAFTFDAKGKPEQLMVTID